MSEDPRIDAVYRAVSIGSLKPSTLALILAVVDAADRTAEYAPGWYVQAHTVRDSIFGFNGVDWIRYVATEVTDTVPPVGGLVPLGVSSERS